MRFRKFEDFRFDPGEESFIVQEVLKLGCQDPLDLSQRSLMVEPGILEMQSCVHLLQSLLTWKFKFLIHFVRAGQPPKTLRESDLVICVRKYDYNLGLDISTHLFSKCPHCFYVWY